MTSATSPTMRDLGGLSPGGSIALGIVVGVLSTSVQSLGLTLQRKSHILEDEKAPHVTRRPPHRRRRWQLGMAMFLVANILGSSVQISTLPLPVLSTLQASGLVFNSICATLILGEPFTRWSLAGTLLVCSGAVLIAVFGAIPAPAHNLDELLVLLARPPFVAWMALQLVGVVAVAAVAELAGTALVARLSAGLLSLLSLLSSLLSSLRFCAPPALAVSSSSSSAAAAPPLSPSRLRLARGLAYGAISGVLSAHSLLVAKSAVELIVRTIADGNNQFRHWQAWALVLVFVALALTQLYYLHRGLKLVSTSILYPLVFCVYNIIAILDGLIYFRQTDLIGPLRACLISLGTVILLSGVLALSWRLSDEQHPPAVGQSTLTPGLGLVEDTEGDDDYDDDETEALLLGRSDLALLDDRHGDHDQGHTAVGTRESQQLLLPRKYVHSYHTFGADESTLHASDESGEGGEGGDSGEAGDGEDRAVLPTSPLSSRSRRRVSTLCTSPPVSSFPAPASPKSRWMEQAEIWGELEDQSTRRRSGTSGTSGLGGGGLSLAAARRLRSKTLDISTDHAAAASSPGPSPTVYDVDDVDAEALADYRRSYRRKRRSTGFPGFQARRTSRVVSGSDAVGSSSGIRHGSLQGVLRGIWPLRGWWKTGSSSSSSNSNSNSSQRPHSYHAAPQQDGHPLHRPPPPDEDSPA